MLGAVLPGLKLGLNFLPAIIGVGSLVSELLKKQNHQKEDHRKTGNQSLSSFPNLPRNKPNRGPDLHAFPWLVPFTETAENGIVATLMDEPNQQFNYQEQDNRYIPLTQSDVNEDVVPSPILDTGRWSPATASPPRYNQRLPNDLFPTKSQEEDNLPGHEPPTDVPPSFDYEVDYDEYYQNETVEKILTFLRGQRADPGQEDEQRMNASVEVAYDLSTAGSTAKINHGRVEPSNESTMMLADPDPSPGLEPGLESATVSSRTWLIHPEGNETEKHEKLEKVDKLNDLFDTELDAHSTASTLNMNYMLNIIACYFLLHIPFGRNIQYDY